MSRDRQSNLNVRLDGEELAMLHALADDADKPIARVIRSFIVGAYREKFGDTPPPPPTLKHAARST